MRLQEASIQVKLAKEKELADFANHLMCEAAHLRAHLNSTEGEDSYQLCLPRQEEKMARETIGNKDAQLKKLRAEIDVRTNAKLKEAMGQAWRYAKHGTNVST